MSHSKIVRLLHCRMTNEEYETFCQKAVKRGLNVDEAAVRAINAWDGEPKSVGLLGFGNLVP